MTGRSRWDSPIPDVRTRLIDELQQHFVGLDVENYVTSKGRVRLVEPVVNVVDLAAALLSLHGIAIVDTAERK